MSQIKLVPYSRENMTTVLRWRNSKRIRLNMLDDSIITEYSHQKFLKNLAIDYSKVYFVVELNGLSVASICFTGLDTPCVTWGCYIGSIKPIPGLFLAMVLIAAQYAFSFPGTMALRSEVAVHNLNPIKLNKYLGISETARFMKTTTCGNNVEFIEYHLHSDEVCIVINKALKVMPSSMKKSYEKIILEK